MAIHNDPVSDIAFPVFWQRDPTDPTVFSLESQNFSSNPGVFTDAGIFANISGSEGDSLDPQETPLVVLFSGYVLDRNTYCAEY